MSLASEGLPAICPLLRDCPLLICLGRTEKGGLEVCPLLVEVSEGPLGRGGGARSSPLLQQGG